MSRVVLDQVFTFLVTVTLPRNKRVAGSILLKDRALSIIHIVVLHHSIFGHHGLRCPIKTMHGSESLFPTIAFLEHLEVFLGLLDGQTQRMVLVSDIAACKTVH